MKSNWTEYSVETFAEVYGGGTPSTSNDSFFGGEIPWITPKDLSNYPFRFISKGERNITKNGLMNSSATILPTGTVLLTSRAPVGYLAIATNPISTNQGFKSLVVKDGFNNIFIYYLLKSNVEFLKSFASGSTFAELSGSTLKNLRFTIPHLDEQRAIADVLSALDDKIELNLQMNRALEQLAQTLFKHMFFENPEREQWEQKPLPELIEINPYRKITLGDSLPYLDMANTPAQGHRAIEWINREFRSGSKFTNGDTLLARITPCLENGKTAFVDFLKEGQTGWGSTEFIVLHPKEPLPPEFGYFLARSNEFREFVIQNMSGTTGRQRVPNTCFSNYLISNPPEQLSRSFGTQVKDIMTLIKENDNQSRALREIRDTLLPKLMSGQVRVIDLLNESQ